MQGGRQQFKAAIAAAAVALLFAGDALATEGYFQYGYGARQKGLAGAGVADSRDATAITLNPAGLVHVDDQFTFSVTAFSPQREYDAGLPGCAPGVGGCAPVPPGEHGSDRNLFAIPNMTYSRRIGPDTVFALGVYGNGGMNTTYPYVIFDGSPTAEPPTGVDLTQVLISGAIAHRWGKVSVGVAPILALQFFEAEGIGGFAPFSSDPSNFSDTDYDFSYGAGVRLGIEYAATPWLRFGVAGNSRIYMTEFDKYSGLFAEQGDFDIPASVTAGVAIDLRPDITLMVDYKHIWYGDVKSIANPQANIFACMPGAPGSGPGCLGNDGGAGFGWHDIDIIKVGIEWRYDDQWTFRAGYAYNENPIQSEDVTINVLAPGVVEHHITGGFKYKWSDDFDVEFAAAFVPETTVSGVNPFGGNQDLEISMWQMEATLGVVWHLDQPEAPLEPLK